MKKTLLVILCIIVIAGITAGGYLMKGYSQRRTLKAALDVTELPDSLKILDYTDYGVSSFRAEFYLSIPPTQFDSLIKGRAYEVRSASTADLQLNTIHPPGKAFVPVVLCKWGTATNRTIIYTNITKSLAYVVWDAN